MLRIIGIDYGIKRVGLAMADPFRMFAQPLGTFTPTDALTRLIQIHRDIGIELIVIGWPLTLDDEETEITQRVQEYINRLSKKLKGIPVLKYDERYSSRRASKALVDAGVKKKARQKKGRLDAAAASIILQDYLDEANQNEDVGNGGMV